MASCVYVAFVRFDGPACKKVLVPGGRNLRHSGVFPKTVVYEGVYAAQPTG